MIINQPITSYEMISLIISTIGFIAVIISLWFLRSQTKEMAKQSEAISKSLLGNIYESVTSQMHTVDELFIQHPELRPYFYRDKDINASSPDYERVEAMAELLLDNFGSILLQEQQFEQIWPTNWWIEYIVFVLSHSPIMRHFLDEHASWYNDELKKALAIAKTRMRVK